MKRFHVILISLLALCASVVQAQVSVETTSGITTAVTGSLNITLDGNWTNNGTLNAGSGTILLNGGGVQTITNANGAFNNLTINKASGDAQAAGNFTVDGIFTLTSGDVDLNSKVIMLGTNALLAETAGNTVKGATGYIETTRDLNAPSSDNVGGLGFEITSAANLGSTVIQRGHAAQSGNGNESIFRYFDVTPANNSGLNATLLFRYDDSELNSQTEANLALYKSDDGGSTWSAQGGAADGGNNTVTLSGVEAFSRWSAAEQSLGSAPAKPFVFLANKITLESTKQVPSYGDLHSNGTLFIEKGEPSTYYSNLTAVGKITIEKYNTINGDVTSQTSISNSGKINGTKTIGPVDSEPLPSLSYSAGGPNKTVPSSGSLTLAPGSYGNVTMSNNGKLKLTSGEYFMNQLRYSSTIEGGVIEIDLSSGNPVTINVVSNLQLGHEAAIVLLPNGEADSKLVTFNTLQTTNANWGREAYLLGSFNTPNAVATLVKNTQLRGAIYAKEIFVSNDCLFLHHDSPGSLPGPGNLPKTAPLAGEVQEVGAEPVTSYALLQNYPNPFNPTTMLTFELPEAGEVSLSIYNMSGQLVKKLVHGEYASGKYEVMWDATNEYGRRVASGVYLYVIKAVPATGSGQEFTEQRKLVLMK